MRQWRVALGAGITANCDAGYVHSMRLTNARHR